jgi:hypothetical protein
VYGLRNGELLFSVRGKPIPAVLPVSAMRRDERAADEAPREWLVDFDRAVEVGMALIVHLEEADPSVDQLFALGLAADADVSATAGRLDDALAAHAYQGALEFIPPGTPTNNTAESPSAWHSSAAPAMSPDALRVAVDAAGPQNAAAAARALGLRPFGALAGVPGAADDWHTSAGIMIDALWAGLTIDWDMLRRRDMNFEGDAPFPMAPFDDETYAALRSDAAAFVRGRGPLASLRIRRASSAACGRSGSRRRTRCPGRAAARTRTTSWPECSRKTLCRRLWCGAARWAPMRGSRTRMTWGRR